MSQNKQCLVCDSPVHPMAQFCKRCKKVLDRVDMRRTPDRAARVEALRRAWDGEGFRCYYSGIRLVETKCSDPRYLTFDHRTPRQEADVVLAAACLNDMKSDMTEAEFRAVVLQLVSRFQGGPFDEKVLELTHWKR
jgi:transposase InsO family protein